MTSAHAAARLVETLSYKPESRGSIPDDVTGIFHLRYSSGLTTALGSTQTLTEMITSRVKAAGAQG